jgi:hypothetical protein
VADLPLDQSRALAGLMLQLHGDFRRRHGLPPLPTVWNLTQHLEGLRGRASLVDTSVMRSRAQIVGAALTAGRRALWEILKPLFYRQTEVNRDVVLALEALARDREQSRHAQHVLSERITALEATVARLRARSE